MSKSEKKQAASIVWFEIPADDVERARKFYGDLFDWKIERFPGPQEYWHIDTGGGDDTPDGALKKRKQPQEPITNYVSVNSVTEFSKKIEKLGGKIFYGLFYTGLFFYYCILNVSRNLVVKSAWRRQPCRKWVISACARTPRVTRLEFGRAT